MCGFFDFFKSFGKVAVTTDKMSYSYGETISGKAVVSMSEPKQANALRLEFYAEKKVPSTDSHGHRTTRTQRVHEFTTNLEGAGEYSGVKEYVFHVKIPEGAQSLSMGGIVGQVAEFAVLGRMPGFGFSQLKWYLKASLDIPGGKDVSSTIQVNVA